MPLHIKIVSPMNYSQSEQFIGLLYKKKKEGQYVQPEETGIQHERKIKEKHRFM